MKHSGRRTWEIRQVKSRIGERRQTSVAVTLALSMGLASLGTSIANIALPALATAFEASFPQVQAVVVAYLATLTVSVVGAGRLGDRYGLKPILIAGLSLFLGASLLCSIAPTLWLLVGARAVQGVGAAFVMTLSMALMRQTADAAHVGRAMGLLGTMSALGTALGPSLGGLLIPALGWRGVFWVQVPLATVALLMALASLPADVRRGRMPTPGLGSALNWTITPNLIVNLLVAAVMMTTLVVGPFYLGVGLGLPATGVGFVMAVGPVISIFSGLPSGRLVDRWGSDRLLAFGLALLTAGALLLALLPNLLGVAGYVLSVIILTPGYQLFQAANNTAALMDVPEDRRGTVSGLLALSRNVGLIGGAFVMGAVFAFGVGTKDFTHASAASIATSMRLTFLLASAMMVATILIAFGSRASRACI